jgi:hypothetical protein
MVDNEKPFKLSKQSEDNLSVPPSLSKEYPETGYNFQDTAFLANQLCQTHDNCAFVDTKEVLLYGSYGSYKAMYGYIQNSINGKSNVVTGEIFINKDSEMLMLGPILLQAVVCDAEKIVCPLNLTYPPKESHAVAFCMNENNDGTYNAVILEQHAQNKAKDKERYKPELDYSGEISKLLGMVSSLFSKYKITVNTKYNEKPICREEKVCGIVSMEACKRLLEAENPVALAEEGFSLTADDVKKLHNQNIQNYNQKYDPLSSVKEPENLEQDTKQKIHDLRKKIQAKEHDPLEMKQRELAQGLRDRSFSENDMGKTGDSRTGQVTEKHRAIAASQIKKAKQSMLQRR